MSTAFITHPACAAHETGQFHPECGERLTVIQKALDDANYPQLYYREAPRASISAIEKVHPRSYIDKMLGVVPKYGMYSIDGDTVLSPFSGEAAIRAVGAVIAAVDAVSLGEVHNAFCSIRPPGHHAEPTVAMGFCIFNNVAIGAHHARAMHRFHKVGVVDFDVHHGNGTQKIFWDDANLFYASCHQFPCYPGTGTADETGCASNIVNVPLPPGSGSSDFRRGITTHVLPALRKFQPDFLLISAGFDAHSRDPLANLYLDEDDFSWITKELMEVASECCSGRLVSVLEGGYDLLALANSVVAHVRELLTA